MVSSSHRSLRERCTLKDDVDESALPFACICIILVLDGLPKYAGTQAREGERNEVSQSKHTGRGEEEVNRDVSRFGLCTWAGDQTREEGTCQDLVCVQGQRSRAGIKVCVKI